MSYHFTIRKLQRCPTAKHSFVLGIEAHDFFAAMDELKEMLGTEQLSSDQASSLNQRPWYFVLVKDSIAPGYRNSDGKIGLRLYINDEAIAVQFLLLCGSK